MTEPTKELAEKPTTLNSLIADLKIRKRFDDVLGERSNAFLSSLLSLCNTTPQLQNAEPRSILAAAMTAATLDMPINRNLGFAAIVPYDREAQFQIMAKGFIQLGLRSAQYKTMHVTEVYKDEIKSWNPLAGEFEATPWETWKLRELGKQEDIVGYMAYMKLHNGFEKYLYWTVAQVRAHAKKYSKSFENPNGQWMQNFNAMALKTLIKMLLSKWGVLSVQMEKAIEVDQAVIDTTGEITYPDRPEDEPIATKPIGADRKINENEIRLLHARTDNAGVNPEEVKDFIRTEFKLEHRHDLSVQQLTTVLKWIEKCEAQDKEKP